MINEKIKKTKIIIKKMNSRNIIHTKNKTKYNNDKSTNKSKINKLNKINNINKKRKIKTKKINHKKYIGGSVIMYRVYDDDDNTINNQKDRCMCIDYKFTNNKFSTKHNQKLRRCKNKKEHNHDFCKEHMNCMGFLRNFLSGYEPKYNEYELKKWKHPYVESSHNCYSYFLNDTVQSIKEKCREDCLKKNKNYCPKKIEECRDYIPQPGDFDLIKKYGNLDKKERIYKCDHMEKKIFNDNPSLFKVKINDKCPKNYYKGSMVVDTDHTFHFYRQNANGTWSHKPGTLPVTDKDANMDKIYIPHFSARDYTDGDNDDDAINYNDFCGYYCIPTNEYSSKNSA